MSFRPSGFRVVGSQDLFHLEVAEFLSTKTDRLLGESAKPAMLEERPRGDARLGVEPNHTAGTCTSLGFRQKRSRQSATLARQMHIEVIDVTIGLHRAEP